MDTLEAVESLAHRQQLPTPDAVREVLDPQGTDPSITPALVAQGLAQVRRWQEQQVTHDVLRQRRELLDLKWELYLTMLECQRLQRGIETLLEDLDRLLQRHSHTA
jgi:hypothetical protein